MVSPRDRPDQWHVGFEGRLFGSYKPRRISLCVCAQYRGFLVIRAVEFHRAVYKVSPILRLYTLLAWMQQGPDSHASVLLFQMHSCRLPTRVKYVCKRTTQFVKHVFAISSKAPLLHIVHTPHHSLRHVPSASDLASCFRPCMSAHKYFAASNFSVPTHLFPLHEVEEGSSGNMYTSLDEGARSTQHCLYTMDRTSILLDMVMPRSTISEDQLTRPQGPTSPPGTE